MRCPAILVTGNVANTGRAASKAGSDTRKAETLPVRIDSAETTAFEDAAAASGMAVSAGVRERLRAVAARAREGARLTGNSPCPSIEFATYASPDQHVFFGQTDDGQWHDYAGASGGSMLDGLCDRKTPICPLEAGNGSFRRHPGGEWNPNAQFGFEVALAEPQVPTGEPVLPFLVQLAQYVAGVGSGFAPRFR